MKLERLLRLPDLLAKKSFFLFGPRGTGKTSLLREQLKTQVFIIDLLKSDFFLRLSANPGELEEMIGRGGRETFPTVVIDEIQKIPALLDEVHRLIEEKKLRFLLTGSSARKLRRGAANLLGGRAWTAHLFPLTWKELPEFDLERYLRFGGLPHIYLSDDPEEELQAYARTYLYEEIQAEALVRNLPNFSRFLKSTALSNAQLLNFSNISNDTGVPASTVKEFYTILEDTLIGFLLEPWIFSKKRKAISTAKFYFFDPGVTHTLAGTKSVDRNSDLFGRSFEQWMGMELRAYMGYKRIHDPLCFWRSTHQDEVDFVIGDHTAIEVKTTRHITGKDLASLVALGEESVFKSYFLVSNDPIATTKKGIRCLPWKIFLDALWGGDIF